VADDIAARVDDALASFLDASAERVGTMDPASSVLVDEVRRLLAAGGKRIRPAFCYWGFRAAGGADEGASGDAIVRAAAALELLHTMAIVHDDLIDGAKERRGIPTTEVWFAEHAGELGAPGDPAEHGRSMAILVGDLCAVWADELLDGSGFEDSAVARARVRYDEMRVRMAVGQVLDVGGAAGGLEVARHAAALKGGSYTVEGPLLIGAALGDASTDVEMSLTAFARPLGEAFQLRDDLDDGDAPAGVTRETVASLVEEATSALDPSVLDPEAIEALAWLADRIAR
jgi:geranylgeranyl diphosphate synthase, type I